MARFDDIHDKAMRPGRAMVPGEVWNVAIKEPLGSPTRGNTKGASVTIIQFRCERTPCGSLRLRATPESSELIKAWNIRHQHTPESAFGLPDGIFR